MTAQQTPDLLNTPGELSLRLVALVRDALKMTQKEFARLVGMHPQTVSDLERKDLELDDELRVKLLMLHEISGMPGVPSLLKHLLETTTGSAALYVATSIHLAAA